MEIVIGLAVLLAVALGWALVVDRRQRRLPPTGHNPMQAGKRARIAGEQKGSEWGAGGW